MEKQSASNSSSTDQPFPNPLLPDPKGTDHTPRVLYKGRTIFPRTLWRLLHDGIVSGREFAALIVLIDQTDGWPVLNRSWVRLTINDWSQVLGVTRRGGVKVRNSLLKKGLITRLRSGRSYIYRMAPDDEIEEIIEQHASEPSTINEGFVYLAECSTGHFKIGKSVNPAKRVRHFDTQMPVDTWLRHSFPATPYAEAEKRLHERFDAHRVDGEWFELSDESVSHIESIERFEEGRFVFET